MRKYISFLAVSILALSGFPVHAQDIEDPQEIFISVTQQPFPVIDGKWGSPKEWTYSTEKIYFYEDNAKLAVRTAHDRENIYILLDMVTDVTLDKQKDRALICFDTEVDGGDRPKPDDYCFISVLDGQPTSYKGGGSSPSDNYLTRMANPNSAEMRAGVSSTLDRYSSIPHLSYEFKIPVEALKRTDVFGFYVAVFDASSKKTYTWPLSMSNDDNIKIEPPSEWGKLISPDKSIPEFPMINILFLAGAILFCVTLLPRYRLMQ